MMTSKQWLAHFKPYIAASHAFYRILTRISPKWNSMLRFRKTYGKKLELKNPVWFSEKLMWLKLNCYGKSPLVRRCANKALAREYVRSCGLERLLIKTYGIWNSEKCIPWDKLPDQFVIKSAIGCGGNVICKSKTTLDQNATMHMLHNALHSRQELEYAEMQYRVGPDLRPALLSERLLESPGQSSPADYKFYCFHGEPHYILLCYDRKPHMEPKYMFMDLGWTPHPELHPCSSLDNPPPRPDSLDEMIACAQALARPFPFVRVDLYDECGTPFFGELTFTPSACLDRDHTLLAQKVFGELIDLTRFDKASFLQLK